MRVSVLVTPGARHTRVERIDANSLRVTVSAPAREGRANAAVVKAVAEFLNVAPSRVRIVRGAASRHKILEITRGDNDSTDRSWVNEGRRNVSMPRTNLKRRKTR